MMALSFELPLLPLIIGLPLLAAIASLLISSYRWRAGVSVVFAMMQLLVVVLLLWAIQDNIEAQSRYLLGGWGAPLGIDLAVDGLSSIMLLATAVLVLILSIYSTWYFSDPLKAARFWPLWWLLVTGLNVAFVAADAFNIYVALELIGLASVALVALAGGREAYSAALRYALVGLLGSLCYLLGVTLLYRAYGTLDLAQLATLAQANPITWAALSLISVGLLLKTALLPLHFWLPPAHASAPAPVSAVLSALVVKASFYLLVRFWLDVLSPAVTDAGLYFMGVLGSAAIIFGCIAAFRAQRLKLLVAYSTVAQLGYLFLLFPLTVATEHGPAQGGTALGAVAYFIIAHALAKSAMFLAAGNILLAYGHDDINKLQGLVRYQPLSVFTFAIAGVSLIGLPPSGGFIAKWLLLNSAITSGQWWWVIVMLGGGLLAATYIFRVLNLAFMQADARHSRATNLPRPVPSGMAMCGLVLALLAILLGFNAEWILELVENNMAIVASNWEYLFWALTV
jgi:formate hydrogenlyase subunit 3/multisubunit Na+/H+ antiporter MnhD subunit